jgi:aryl-alcohol dehydrogenase-like predicted oxidoreductase
MLSLEMVLNLHTPLDLWYLHDVSVNELPAALNTTLQFIDILKILAWLVSFGEYRYNCLHVFRSALTALFLRSTHFTLFKIVWEVLTRLDHEGTYADTVPFIDTLRILD